ncbi:hypothetical protein UFOVP474_27 [uncultured Caudovirales phage]|uniref:Uncharacterized protein n=1 Tax=uncultured Caudovirales phage TaxID=2100421 RepID=A0A6J5R842_9CAUD|nr:hypothetical protein UFOVP474_27 [uncultured Caudovirales phage]CAB4189701.1 hypothetical protein UFOVP1207_23 [uncultured Caudovirales phage]
MAATSYTPISLYYSTTAATAPSAANLIAGELALNTLDEKLYFKNSAGTVKLLASNAASGGTVSSVAMSVPAFLSIAGSPITTSGTLAVTYSGTALPVANGGTGVTTSTGTTNVVLSNSPVLVTPDLGTPSALVGTNITGTATAFTSSNVTTNANLTGDVTSVGNASTLATVNSNVGAFTNANITVNAKGLITAAANGTAGGTVTSVAATVPAFLSIAGSPITTSGTLAITYSGTALPVANGGTGVTTSTGSGNVVLSTSPTLVTPVLGTPTSGTLSGCTVDGTNGVGYINVPQNAQTGSYTLVAADAGKHIYHAAAAAAATYTIPANGSVAYVIGTAVTFINMSTNNVTVAITTDTLYLGGTGTTGSRTLAQYGVATAVKMTSTTWVITGSGLT